MDFPNELIRSVFGVRLNIKSNLKLLIDRSTSGKYETRVQDSESKRLKIIGYSVLLLIAQRFKMSLTIS